VYLIGIKVGVGREHSIINSRADANPEGGGCLQRIDNMEIGEVLPGTRTGISADENALPAAGRALRVVALKSCAVILSVVAEDSAAALDAAAVADKLIPIVCPVSCRKWPSSVR
jgi:hypothetical protein